MLRSHQFFLGIPIHNGLRIGEALLPLFFNINLEYTIRKAQEHRKGLELNGTYQLRFCADVVNVLGENINAVKKNKLLLA
jgi:hypothetical protein